MFLIIELSPCCRPASGWCDCGPDPLGEAAPGDLHCGAGGLHPHGRGHLCGQQGPEEGVSQHVVTTRTIQIYEKCKIILNKLNTYTLKCQSQN